MGERDGGSRGRGMEGKRESKGMDGCGELKGGGIERERDGGGSREGGERESGGRERLGIEMRSVTIQCCIHCCSDVTEGTGEVYFLSCTGWETHISQCTLTLSGTSQCNTHEHDVTVQCK